MRLELLGEIAGTIFPVIRVGRPLPERRFQVTPPSVDLNKPLPGPPLSRPHVCISSGHMPAYKTFGLFGSISRCAQPLFSSVNSTRVHVLPPSVVRNTPRSACAPYA